MKYPELKGSNLTQSQLLIWAGQMLNPQTPLYNMALAFDIRGAINPEVFKNAFQALIDRCDVLRTVIEIEDDVPKQSVLSNYDYELELLDLSSHPDTENIYKDWVQSRVQHLFGLSEPMFDTVLIKMADNRFIWYLNQHHLITDGWSVALVYKSLVDLYTHSVNNTISDVPSLPSYYEYATHSKIAPDSKVANYWKEKLKDLPLPPNYYGFSKVVSCSSSTRVSANLGVERSEKIRKLAQEKEFRAWTKDLSHFNIFATALFAFLFRVSSQRKLVVGTPAHNRSNQLVKQTAGLFIEVFPFSIEIEKEDTFVSLFKKVQHETFDLLKHAQTGQAFPELGRSFNVILNYINASFADFNGFPMQSDWVHPGHHDPNHHMRLQIHDYDKSGNIALHFDLNNSVFDDTIQSKLPDHFIQLLDHFIADKTQLIDNCNMLSDKEKNQVLFDFNQTKVAYPQHETLVSLFEKQVEYTPQAIALVFEEKKLTYEEFNEKANQLAHFLRKQGVRTDNIIGVVMERSIDMMIAIYGILKAGGAYLPIDPCYPEHRINFMLEDAEAKIVLTESKLARTLTTSNTQFVNIDTNWTQIAQEPLNNPNASCNSENLAYMIYTSGSTGQPKGVMIEHKSICNRLFWMQDEYELTKKDSVLQKTPYTFDVSVWELFWPLQVGAKLVISKAGGHKDPDYLIQTIRQNNISTIHFVPSMLSVFLENKNAKNCIDLKQVFCSGEALPMNLQSKFFNTLKSNLHNLYGPTEASVDVTSWICQRQTTDIELPIGKPVANTQLYILNESLQVVPIGVAGELYIGGVQLARAYLNRPELTKERFIDNPFVAGSRLYKTGDLSKWRPDGNIVYLGRIDNQVKIRGQRIELGEIIHLLKQQAEIDDAIVLAEKNTANDKELLAFYVPANGMIISKNTIKTNLGKYLPNYMIPTRFTEIAEFPLTTNGKIDRKALLAVDHVPITTQHFIGPNTEIEEMLAEIWTQVLRVEKISIDANFIDLGGHSLTAIRLLARINEAFDLELPLNAIFEKPTIAAFAEYIEKTIETLLAKMDME